MATSFEDIYNLNSVIRLDGRLYGKPKNLLYQFYFNLLSFSITYFEKPCYKDLNDRIDFTQIEYSFVGDGINNVFTLDSTPLLNGNYYVSVDNNTNISYTINNDNTITIIPIPNLNSTVYVSNYIIGQFNTDLSTQEKVILAEGMNVPWLEQTRNNNELLNQMVYGRDFSIYSQSAHIKELNNSLDNQYYKNVLGMINKYSYTSNPKGLLGLGGGLT